MIKKKYELYVFVLLMVTVLSGAISFFNTIINIGFANDLLAIWLKSWTVSFLIAYPVALIVVPQVRKIMKKIIIEN